MHVLAVLLTFLLLHGLGQTEGHPSFLWPKADDLQVDLLVGLDDLAWLGDATVGQLGDGNEAFDVQPLDRGEGPVLGQARNSRLHYRPGTQLLASLVPRVGQALAAGQADAVLLPVNADDGNLKRLPDLDDLRRMLHPRPGHLGDVEQAVDAAQVHEGAIVGDVPDLALADHAFRKPCQGLGAAAGPLLLHDLTVGEDDLLVTPVGLDDTETQRAPHEAVQVPDIPGAHLRGRNEPTDAEVDSQAAFDPLGDHRRDGLLGLQRLEDTRPHGLVVGLLLGELNVPLVVGDAHDGDIYGVAFGGHLSGAGELGEGYDALVLTPDVDDNLVRPHLHDRAFHNLTGPDCLEGLREVGVG